MKRSRKPIPRQSKKRARQHFERMEVLAEVRLRDGPSCWAKDKLSHLCAGPMTGHEVISRARYPDGHLDVDNVRLVCAWANDWCEDHPDEAIERGLTRHSWER